MGNVLEIFGGLGIFLVGMAVMTEQLKSLAGESFRRWLARFTKSPTTGALTGAIGTAALQSSSATSVMAVGFAGAGLLTFSQSLGIIFGANIGTTITGWMVALLGFKLHLTKVVMPLVLVGSLMRLFGGKRIAAIGFAMAGFGLIFVGIGILQSAMEGLGSVLTPESFPPNTWSGRALLVLIGVGITLATQSSSAGVATALTAVHIGTITLPQAAALVIGMDIGTTFTAALAAVGGSVNARRTGVAHVVYNLMTGAMAYLILPVFIGAWQAWSPAGLRNDPEIALVFFHSLFNIIGVLLVLPFTAPFAKMIVRFVPTRGSELQQRLDHSLLQEPAIALDLVQTTMQTIAADTFELLSERLLDGDSSDFDERLRANEDAINETRRYIGQIDTGAADETTQSRHRSSIHVIDHLGRMTRRCRIVERWEGIGSCDELQSLASQVGHGLKTAIESFQTGGPDGHQHLEHIHQQLESHVEPFRRTTIQRMVSGIATDTQALACLDAIRWLRRVSYHSWRISIHLDPTTRCEWENDSSAVEHDPNMFDDPHEPGPRRDSVG